MQSNAKKVTRSTVKRRHADARANTHFLPNGQIFTDWSKAHSGATQAQHVVLCIAMRCDHSVSH